jgi:cytochrome c553
MTRTRTRHPGQWLALGIVAAACIAAQCSARAAPTTATATPGSATCAACHGAQGEGSASGAPRLAGQDAQYLEHALAMFKAGTRASPIMQSVASGLSDADSHELSLYFASMRGTAVPVPAPASVPPPADLVTAGQELAQVGAMADPTPPCVSCHGIDGHGAGARFPNVAGQPATFIVDRLHAFQARAKAKAPDFGTMTEVATHLNETQIEQVAAYLSTLPPP